MRFQWAVDLSMKSRLIDISARTRRWLGHIGGHMSANGDFADTSTNDGSVSAGDPGIDAYPAHRQATLLVRNGD
jgi:hypothetical protein